MRGRSHPINRGPAWEAAYKYQVEEPAPREREKGTSRADEEANDRGTTHEAAMKAPGAEKA